MTSRLDEIWGERAGEMASRSSSLPDSVGSLIGTCHSYVAPSLNVFSAKGMSHLTRFKVMPARSRVGDLRVRTSP